MCSKILYKRRLPISSTSMYIDKKVARLILTKILSLSFWKDFWNRISVVAVGSVSAGMSDSHSDLDIHVLVPAEDYRIYRLLKAIKQALDEHRTRLDNERG